MRNSSLNSNGLGRIGLLTVIACSLSPSQAFSLFSTSTFVPQSKHTTWMRMSMAEEMDTTKLNTNTPTPSTEKDVDVPTTNSDEANEPIVKVKQAIGEDVSKILSPEIDKNVTSSAITGAALSVASVALIADASITTAVVSGLAAAYVSLKPGMSGSALRSIGKVAWDGMEMAAKVAQETNIDKVTVNVTKALLEKTLPASSPMEVVEVEVEEGDSAMDVDTEQITAEAKDEAETITAEKLEAERFAAEQAEAEDIAEEKSETQQPVVEESESNIIAAEKAEAEKIAAEKAEAEKIAAEKAEAEKIAAEKAEAERITAEKAEAERMAAEKAEAERMAAEKAEAERIAAEKAETEKIAAEKAEADKIAAEKVEAERMAAEKAEADRMAADKAQFLKVEYEKANESETNEVDIATPDNSWFQKSDSPNGEVEKTDMERQAAVDAEATGMIVDNKNKETPKAIGNKNSMKANYDSLGFDNRYA